MVGSDEDENVDRRRITKERGLTSTDCSCQHQLAKVVAFHTVNCTDPFISLSGLDPQLCS